jgi:2-dehydropantoate 2-reductase
MKIAVVGGGAMGGIWAARLAQSQHDISIVDVAQNLLTTIKTQGLTVEHVGQSETVWPRATDTPQEIGIVDVVFFFVKAQHTASAAQMAQPLVDDTTIIVSLQNGWGNADVLVQHYRAEQIVVGVTYHSGTVLAPGRVGHTGKGATYLGPYSARAGLEYTRVVSDLLAGAGIENTPTEEVKTEIWKKLILNAATLPTAALTTLRASELGQPGEMLDLVDAIAAEAVEVAQAQGYKIELGERVERIHAVLAGAGAGKPSMLQDVEGKRKTEIEVINGAVVNAALGLGVAVPLNRACVALIHGLERSWQR